MVAEGEFLRQGRVYRIRIKTIDTFAALLWGTLFFLCCFLPLTTHAAVPPGSYALEGVVQRLEPHQGRWRLYVIPTALSRLPRETWPRQVRLTMGKQTLPVLGDTIRASVRLAPPLPPIMPGSFDYQEYLWRKGIDAVGFVYGKIQKTGHVRPANRWEAARRLLHTQRQRLAAALYAATNDDRGAVLAALVTGERGYIAYTTEEAWRIAGITHLLSISGTHIGLLIGLVFAVVRGGLALTPLVHHYPIKKGAAVLAWIIAGAYTLLAGADVPTVRSFLMASIVLLGVLLDRRAFSLWTLALAGMAILAAGPTALKAPGFQFSFAAVATLIGYYRWQETWPVRTRCLEQGLPGRLLWYMGGLVLSGLLVTIITAPIALYHFQRLAVYGTLANVAAIPLTGILLMPSLLLALVLWPLGGEALPLQAASYGAALLNRLADSILSWPWAQLRSAVLPDAVVPLMACALLCLLLAPRVWKAAALLPVLALIGISLRPAMPDIVIAADGRQVGFFDSHALWVSGKPDSFLAKAWAVRYGLENARSLPAAACDALGCTVSFAGKVIALPNQAEALSRDCHHAAIIITPLTLPAPCGQYRVDGDFLKDNGSTAFFITPMRIITDRQVRGKKPWTGYEKQPRLTNY